jgi:hypothetical protein
MPIEDEAAAMRFAMIYWYLMGLLSFVLWMLPLIVLGIVDHTLLVGGGIRIFLAVVFGISLLSLVEYLFAYFRWLLLRDTEEFWVDADGMVHHLRLRTTKPSDSLLAIATGLFAGAMLLT